MVLNLQRNRVLPLLRFRSLVLYSVLLFIALEVVIFVNYHTTRIHGLSNSITPQSSVHRGDETSHLHSPESERAHPFTGSERTHPFSLEWDNSIAGCAIARQEDTRDVREWLQYHRCANAIFLAPLLTAPSLQVLNLA